MVICGASCRWLYLVVILWRQPFPSRGFVSVVFFLRNRHRRGGVKEKRRIRWTRRTRETQENLLLERTHDTRRDEQKRNSNSIIPKLKPTHPAAAASSPKGELESRDRNRIGCVGPGGGGGMVGCVGSTEYSGEEGGSGLVGGRATNVDHQCAARVVVAQCASS